MIKGEEWALIRQLRNQGLSNSEISRRLGIDRKTVRKHLNSEKIPEYERVKGESKLDEFREYINQRLESYNLTSQKIFRELQEKGFDGAYGIVNLYVKSIKQECYSKAVMRFETLPGEQAQVDWGYFGEFYDYEKRKLIRLCCFFMVLGYSRMRFIHFFDGDDTENFLKGHNLAFEYFGGYTKEILYDNLKSVVIKRAFKQKDSEFNKRFLEFSGYYGFKPILARPYRPQTKGKVENSVRYVKQDFFLGEEFRSLEEINHKKLEWLKRVNTQVHRTTHRKPSECLKEEGLLLLVRAYDLSKVYWRKVQKDCHFSFQGNYYSVSAKFAEKEVSVKVQEEKTLLVYYQNNLITSHRLENNTKGSFITSLDHYQEIKEASFKYYSKPQRKKKSKQKLDTEPTIRRTTFNSAQVIHLHSEVNQRDLNIYQEVH